MFYQQVFDFLFYALRAQVVYHHPCHCTGLFCCYQGCLQLIKLSIIPKASSFKAKESDKINHCANINNPPTKFNIKSFCTYMWMLLPYLLIGQEGQQEMVMPV
jgi:hypothetical protein